MNSEYQFQLIGDTVKLTVNKTWEFSKQDFDQEFIKDIAMIIQAGHICGGCITMPDNGFASEKYHWCDLSRQVAMLQEQTKRTINTQEESEYSSPDEMEDSDEY